MSRLPTARTALLAVSLALLLTATPAAADSYRVRPGDTLSHLALRFGTTTRHLADLNGLSNRDHIVVGRTLLVPDGSSTSASSNGAGRTHLVRSGETLSGIALRYGASVPDLVALNGLRTPHNILAGRELLVSAGSGSRSGGASSVAAPLSVAKQRHVVQSGETLAGIARRYGLSASDLAAWNGIPPSGVVYAHTSLVLYDPGPPPSGNIVCPVPRARFANGWGFPRPGGRVHAGNDLYAPRGTPVHAPVSGTVVTAVGTIGGLHAWLTDPSGNRWLVSHLDRFGKVGRVRAGDIIGYVGDSGNAEGTNPHAHVEFHPAGRGAVNAYPVLRRAC